MPESILGLLGHLGHSIVDLFFVPGNGGLRWVEFVRGYVNCCGRMAASACLNNLLRVFKFAAERVGLAANLWFDSDGAESKVAGYLVPSDLYALLLMCSSMCWSTRMNGASKSDKGAVFYVPDIENLVCSAVVSCAEGGGNLDPWNCDIFSLEARLPAGKFLTWVLGTVPRLPDCFSQFVSATLQCSVASEDEFGPSGSSSKDSNSEWASETHLLTRGKAWAISLTFRAAASEEILRHCFSCNSNEMNQNLLYRSSIHGKGLNRFWANVDGYHGPLLILISASCEDSHHGDTSGKKWTIGVILQQGFENKDQFYGNSGNLYSIDPVFNVFLPSGKENNFVYSHLHPSGRVYEPRPKPVGIAFGGSIGNERVFVDQDFARVTIRHHAVDKTYKPGPLFPNQGFLPVDDSILEVEVWGLGGTTAKKVQTSYKKREELFTEQRRKVDLKTFASWEDSPEKMMMDMVSDPNTVRREDR
ncbi:uncharacterized protein LOC116212783 isoform X2 [Punica granatum]|nr:uncharacterized protein LOC116212783 isoform X2 [Punica granatum]